MEHETKGRHRQEEQQIERKERLCLSWNKTVQSVQRMHECEEGEERRTGKIGREGRIEGGLLSASSDRREADLRQQVLEERERLSQTQEGSDTQRSTKLLRSK